MEYAKLFEPIQIGGTLFRNRIFSAPVGHPDVTVDGDISDDAVAFFQRIVDQNPHDSEAWANIGECYQQSEDFERSIDPFEFALAINPLDIVTNVHLADTYYDLGRYQEAIDTLNEALRHDVEHSAIHSALVMSKKMPAITTTKAANR